MSTALHRRSQTHPRFPQYAAISLVITLIAVFLGASEQSGGAFTTPSYANYSAPNTLSAPGFNNHSTDGAEPTIGSNWATGATMYSATGSSDGLGVWVYKVTWSSATPPVATWTDVTPPAQLVILHSGLESLDTILITDHPTNRTFTSYLEAGCSKMNYTDNDGATWKTVVLGCGIATGVDHQTLAGGPYAPGAGPLLSYPNAVYYCAQADLVAGCARSDTGGDVFGPTFEMYQTALSISTGPVPLTACGGLHGHAKVAPDGTLYVPNPSCSFSTNGTGFVTAQGLIRSTDNGRTFSVLPVKGAGWSSWLATTQRESDPSVAVATDGTVYYGWQDGANNAVGSRQRMSVSHDKGASWSTPVDVGTASSAVTFANFSGTLSNVQFPEVVAGSSSRAAVAFLGTPTGGNDQASAFGGVWHLYVSTTFDGGATWTTVDVTPTDPVQRGMICMAGAACSSGRNLLDFNDAIIDAQGRMLVAYADGCTGTCAGPSGTKAQSTDAHSTIARQIGGTTLF
jgi:hypothetical protein